MKDWQYSACLLIGYLTIFQLWVGAGRLFVVSSGVLWCLVFGIWALVQWRQGYFVNRLDGMLHGVVILDVLLEALLLEEHSHAGFWLCGVGFAAVVGGYRFSALRRKSFKEER